MQRIREGFTEGNDKPFPGPVEVDETYMGGRKKNMSKAKRLEVRGRGPAGKAMVIGAKDRATNNDRKAEASWPSTKGDSQDRRYARGCRAGHILRSQASRSISEKRQEARARRALWLVTRI